MNWRLFKPKREHHVDALDNTVRAWWQSRANLRQLPQLVDLNELARSLSK